MSAPEPNFDQLLSDHLDGRLDETDAQMLQQRMQEDRELQTRFDSMCADREALRGLFASQQSTGPRLSSDFATRVLAESRRRSAAMGLSGASGDPDSAPEIRSLQRRDEPFDALRRRRLSLIIGLVATAVAVLLIASLSLRGRQLGNDVPAVAQLQPVAPRSPDQQTNAVPDREPALPAVEAAPGTSPSPVEPALVPDTIASPQPSPTAVASMPATVPAERLSVSASVSAGGNLAGEKVAGKEAAAPVKSPLFAESPFVGGMIVYDVRLSPQGRLANVVSEAMREVGLQDAPRLPVNREVIAAAKQAETFDEDAKFQVIYLQASAKRVDRLFLNLLREQQLVEGVRLSLITDAPILSKANELTRVDATKVQHEGAFSFELESNSNNDLAAFRELLGEQSFEPLPPGRARGATPQSESLSNTGNDVISRVLILVR